MRFAEQAAMGVDRKASTQLDLATGDELGLTAGLAVAECLKLQQHDISEAVVDL